MKIKVDKLYRYPRINEHLSVCVPLKKGQLFNKDDIEIYDNEEKLPIQTKITSKYNDGSIRFLFIRFIGNLPGCKEKSFELNINNSSSSEKDCAASISNSSSFEKDCVASISNSKEKEASKKDIKTENISVKEIIIEEIKNSSDEKCGFKVDNGSLQFEVEDYSSQLFKSLVFENTVYEKESFYGPVLKDGNNNTYDIEFSKWQIVEQGPLCTVLKVKGNNVFGADGCEEGTYIAFEIKIKIWAGKPYTEISYRIINTTYSDLKIGSLVFAVKKNKASELDFALTDMELEHLDSTGCDDINIDLEDNVGSIIRTIGDSDLDEIEKIAPVENIRTCAATSNYRTNFIIGKDSQEVCKIVDSKKIMQTGNEHFTEVFFGTLFADRTDENSGIAATVYQAYQNYPKAVKADKNAIYIMLVPENVDEVIMPSGTSREQMFLLHFHSAGESLKEIDNRSLIYQMPDLAYVGPEVYRDSEAVTDVFSEKIDEYFEECLIERADGHMRTFGMMNFGDTIDMHYTNQGRGGGSPVWMNNEYDYPHACALMFARTGVRRFMDYNIAHARHWMDVDICHYSKDKDRIGGQIEHTKGHVVDGVQVPSHEWCEGLLDYYHFTGDERGLEAAIGIGENVLRLLNKKEYQKVGEANARETGWALRLFTALYIETSDEKWTEKCKWIVGHFQEWYDENNCFAATYTDNTLVHTGFMIAVAAGSLMRYYRVFPSEKLKKLIMNAVDDIYDNCRLANGLFYYKGLPSLTRNGSNTLLLEAMAIGYELTGDVKYLNAGKRTYIRALKESSKGFGDTKKMIENVIITGGNSTKGFAQSFYPLVVFYKCMVDAGLEF